MLDMFDKLDDIIYKPVETICDWIKEPMNALEAGRDRKKMKLPQKLKWICVNRKQNYRHIMPVRLLN